MTDHRAQDDPEGGAPAPRVAREPFGATSDGRAVERFTLTNAHGVEIRFTTFGATITSIRVPDRQGKTDDVTLGFDRLDEYLGEHPYFGSLVGRYANRIARGRFTLDGREYALAINNPPNHLHGGPGGLHHVLWSAEPRATGRSVGAELTYTSRDGEEGYPGTVEVRVGYTLTDQDELVCHYRATTDAATPLNLTQHTYFNLAGEGSGDVLGHVVALHASRFTPVGDDLIPTGELEPVRGTPLDLTTPARIGARIGEDHPQLRHAGGYDHNWVIDGEPGTLRAAASVYEPTSGRVLEVLTTEPGIQFYTGNFLDGSVTGKGGHVYHHRYGLALETQHFPDSPNQPSFPSTILRPGEEYRSTTVYRFSVRR